MTEDSNRWRRRSIYENTAFAWHIGQVPEKLEIRGKMQKNPARYSAVFVVHGIGEQGTAETAAVLRSGFDDALIKIEEWQEDNCIDSLPEGLFLPAPYIRDGYWANYTDIEETFKEDWNKFKNDNTQKFYRTLWKKRTYTTSKTYRWFLKQQLRLLNPKVIFDISFLAWLFYWPFQIVSFSILTIALLSYRNILSGFLEDVRIYLDPKGVTERAIVQRIDRRVAERFMSLIGLDTDFRPLKQEDDNYPKFEGKPLEFDRVVWVAHSLGTVISYNVLSDLFHKAKEIENDQSPDDKQRIGIERFRTVLKRFITLGSPLDKVAYLFKDEAITPWPKDWRRLFLKSTEPEPEAKQDAQNDKKVEFNWWVNFYHLLDPVSGSLNNPVICFPEPPVNFHIKLFHLPGFAHTSYWTDDKPLRYILGRTYGKDALEDKTPKHFPAWLLTILAFVFQLLGLAIAVALILWLVLWLSGKTFITIQ